MLYDLLDSIINRVLLPETNEAPVCPMFSGRSPLWTIFVISASKSAVLPV